MGVQERYQERMDRGSSKKKNGVQERYQERLERQGLSNKAPETTVAAPIVEPVNNYALPSVDFLTKTGERVGMPVATPVQSYVPEKKREMTGLMSAAGMPSDVRQIMGEKYYVDAYKELEDSIPNNPAKLWWNGHMNLAAKILNVDLGPDYPNYREAQKQLQEMAPTYNAIMEKRAYQDLLNRGITEQDLYDYSHSYMTEAEKDEIRKNLEREGWKDWDIDWQIKELEKERQKKHDEAYYGEGKIADIVSHPAEGLNGYAYLDVLSKLGEENSMAWAQDKPLTASFGSVVLKPFEDTLGVVSKGEQYLTGKAIRADESFGEQSRRAITDSINSGAGKLAYSGAMSIADTAYSAAIARATGGGTAVSAGIQGLEKANQVMNEGVQRGLTPDQIILEGIASGLATAGTEAIPMGKFEEIAERGLTNYGAKEIAKVLGSMALTEGSQEGLEDVADWIYDAIIAGDKSEFNQDVQNYIAQGMSQGEAVFQTGIDRIKEAGTDMAIGGISGVVLGGAGIGGGYVNQSINENPAVITDTIWNNLNAKEQSPEAFNMLAEAVKNIDAETSSNSAQVEKAQEIASKPVEEITKEDIVDLANVVMEETSRDNKLAETIQEINYQAAVDSNIEQYNNTGKIEPREAELPVEQAARQKVESLAVNAEREYSKMREIAFKDSIDEISKEFENEKAAELFKSNYKGQTPGIYASVSYAAYRAGESGQSYETFIENTPAAQVAINADMVTESYLKTLFYQGENTRSTDYQTSTLKTAENIGKIIGQTEEELRQFHELISKKLGYGIKINGKETDYRGRMDTSIALMILGQADNLYSTTIHETYEDARAYNAKGMDIATRALTDMIVKKAGEQKFIDTVEEYMKTYREAGRKAEKGSALAKEANKTFAEAQDEFINDAITYIFSTKEGMTNLVNYILDDESFSTKEKKSAIQAIKDLVDNLIKNIRSYIEKHEDRQLGYKVVEQLEWTSEELDNVSNMLLGVLEDARLNKEAQIKELKGETKAEEGEVAHSVAVPVASNTISVNGEDVKTIENGTFAYIDGVKIPVIKERMFTSRDLKKEKKVVRQLIRDHLREMAADPERNTVYIKSGDENAIFDDVGVGKYVYGSAINPHSAEARAKYNAVFDIRSIIENATEPWNGPDKDGKHGDRAKRGWNYYIVDFLLNDRDNAYSHWMGRLCIRLDANEKDYIYDIDKITKIEKETQRDLKITEIKRAGSPSDISVSDSGEDINTQDTATLEEALQDIPEESSFSVNVPVEQTKDLIAIHNMHEDELIKTLELGGFPMPSIAITKAKMGHDMYGDISVLFRKDTIDPAKNLGANKVYSGDAYTPEFPQVDYKLDSKKAKNLYNKLEDIVKGIPYADTNLVAFAESNMEEKANRHSGNLAEAYMNNDILKKAYLKEKGIEIDMPMREFPISDYHDDATMIEIANLLTDEDMELYRDSSYSLYDKLKQDGRLDKIVEILNKEERQRLTDDKKYERFRTKELNPTRYGSIMYAISKYMKEGLGEKPDILAYTNLVDAEVEKNQKDYEKWLKNLFSGIVEKPGIYNGKDYIKKSGNRRTWNELHDEYTLQNIVDAMLKEPETGSGVGGYSFFGSATREFESIDDIKSEKDRLKIIDEDEYSALQQDIANELNKIASRMTAKTSYGEYSAMSDIAEAVAKNKTSEGVKKFLSQWYRVTDKDVVEIMALAERVAQLPTGYFEAKPQRAVGFDEVASFVIPSDDTEIASLLDEKGLPYVEYKRGDKESRVEAVNSVDDISFSLEIKANLTPEENDYITSELINRNSLDDETTFITKDGKIGVRNNRSLYIVDEMNDTEDSYRPIRIYDVDIKNNSAKHTAAILQEIEENEKNGRPISESLSQICLASRGLSGSGNYIRFYDFEIMRGGREYYVGKSGKAISTPIKTTRNRKNGARHFEQRPDYKKYSLTVPSVDNQGRELSEGQRDFFRNSVARDENGKLLVLYHGSYAKFNEFELREIHNGRVLGDGFYFTPSMKAAKTWATDNIYKVYLNITNPYYASAADETPADVKEKLREQYSRLYDTMSKDASWWGNKYTKEQYFEKEWEESLHIAEDGLVHLDDSTEVLKSLGYDGIIYKDAPGNFPLFGGEQYVAFYPNQIKKTTNKTPSEGSDIRHSLNVDYDSFFDAFEEIDEKATVDTSDLHKFLEDLGDIESEATKKSIAEVVRNIKKQYHSSIDTKALEKGIKGLFTYMKSTGKISMDDVMTVAAALAKPVLSTMEEVDPAEQEAYDKFLDAFKGYKIALDDGQMQEVRYKYGSYYDFKRAMSGKVDFNKNGTPLDNIWTELCDKSGGVLSYGTNPNEQPIAIAEAIESFTPKPYSLDGESLDTAAQNLALEMFRQFFVQQSMSDAADKVKSTMDKRVKAVRDLYKQKLNDAIKTVEAEKAMNMKRLAAEIESLTEEEQEAIRNGDTVNQALIENIRQDYKKRYERLQAQTNDKIVQAKAKYQNAWVKKNITRETSDLKHRLLREVQALQNIIAHPKEGASKHVPINLIKPTIEMLEAINLDNGGRNKTIVERLKKMSEVYESFKNDESYSFDYDERIAADIAELRKMFENRSYADLNIPELQRVLDIVKALKTQILNANNLILNGKYEDAQEASKKAIRDVENSRRHDNAAMNALNKYANIHLNAYREFRKLSGYKDGELMKIYRDLDEGSKREMQIQKDLGEIFSNVLEGNENQKEVKRFISTKPKDLVDIGITDKNGKPILITRAMRMSLIMHAMNAGNMRHILGSGITVPNMYYFEKGKLDEAYAKGTNYRFVDFQELLQAMQNNDMNKVKELSKAAQDRIEGLKADLNEWEKQFLADAEEMFHEETGKLINDTSMQLKGYALARVKNYFPIKTDSHFTKQEWSGLVRDGSLEGMGMLKERVISTKPILLEDITNVIQRQIKNVSKYAGYAVPVRNFETLMKQTSRDQQTGQLKNLYETIDNTWGASDSRWLQNLMQDIQGGRHEKSNFLMDLRGKFAGATLTLNPSVAIKQAASYPTAAAVVGYKALGRAMADIGRGFGGKGIAELEKINPLLWYRMQGYGTQELADAKASGFGKNLPVWAQKATNWTQWFDTGTVRTLEYAAKYYVDDNFKNLKEGTDEYWQKVSEVFSKIVEETQPNYSTLQKADIIRDPNSLKKMLVMFKTQPMQNFGIIYDAMGELNAAKVSGNKAWIKEASSNAALAVSSQVVSASVFSAMTILSQLLLHRWWKYRDDDGEWSWKKLLTAFGEGVLSCMTGALIGGSELYEALKHIFTGSSYYGIEVSVAEMVNDFVENVGKITKNAKGLWDAKTSEDKEKAAQKLLGASINLGSTVGEFKGTPVNNIKNMLSSMYFYVTDIVNSIDNGELTFSDDSNIATWDIKTQYQRIYEALQSGNASKYDKLVQELVNDTKADNPDLTDEEITEKVEKKVSDKITDMLKEGWLEGEVTDEEMSEYLMEEGGKTEDEAYFQMRKWETGETSDYGVMKDLINTASGDYSAETRRAVIEEVDNLLAHGKTKEGIASTLTSTYKAEYIELYKQGKAADLNAILRAALVEAGYTDDKAKKKLEGWLE